VFHNGYGQVRSIINKSRNVILGHLWELFLEDALQARQDDEAVVRSVIVDDSELDITSALF
jgi:hypothetical protein